MAKNITIENLIGALYNGGADATLIETEEVAQLILDEIESEGVYIEEIDLDDEQEYEIAMAQLDLTDINNPEHIYRYGSYNSEKSLICLACDWSTK